MEQIRHGEIYYAACMAIVVIIPMVIVLMIAWVMASTEPAHSRLTCSNAIGGERVALHCNEGRP